jgi:hypothetical protein
MRESGDEMMRNDVTEDDDHADVPDATWVTCPYCGEEIELLLDLAGGAVQQYVEDCEVCCRPWNVRVELEAGFPIVRVSTQDEV